MIFFIDTNIFYNNWYLQNPNFKYLFNYISNTKSKILISEVVCMEVNNKVNEEIKELKNHLGQGIKKYYRLVNKNLELNVEDINPDYDFKNILLSKTESVIFYNYSNIENSLLVNRAIKKVRPFQNEDKGFRDTLIWLSFLEYLKAHNADDDVIFINSNSTDFYNKSCNDFHDDLKNDVLNQGIRNNFKVFKDLYSFVSTTIDKSKHGITVEEIYEQIVFGNEKLIEYEIENYVNQLPVKEVLKFFLRNPEEYRLISSISNFKFNIFEGLEDVKLINYEVLSNQLVYLQLNFNLRIVEVEYQIPTFFYKENYEFFEKRFCNSEEIEGMTKMYDFLRIEFTTSFTFNRISDDIDSLVINKSKIIK